MSPSPQLAPPGSSSYDSGTMHVGDGTWDAGRDTFLLPNLVGTNFATTRYNGMGNRFFTMTGYHALVRAHGILAAITFLGAVPTAIFLMRFYGRNPRLALRMHIWLQILTLLLTTVVFILGFMAVGPNRSLSNPHHGIGVAIYVLLWVQVFGGCVAHRGRAKTAPHTPLRVMLHQWFGRAIALLGITQVALGLTLYGSPLYLFVLYTLLMIAYIVVYFILSYLAERRQGQRFGDRVGSYYSDEVVSRPGRQKERGGWGKWILGGAAALGLASLWRRRSQKQNNQHDGALGTETSMSSSYISEEKYSHRPEPRKEKGGFGNRLLQIAAIGGAVAAAKKIFGGRGRDDESDVGPYRPPLGGNQSVVSDSMSRIEEGRPNMRPTTPLGTSPGHVRPTHPLAQPPLTPGSGRRRSSSTDSYYDDSYLSGSPSRRDRRSHTFRDALAAGGAAFAVRSLFKNRRQRKEDMRSETLRRQRIEQEKIQRMNSAHKYTGDEIRPPRRTHGRMGSQSATDLSSALDDNPHHGMSGALPAAGVGAAAASALADRNRIRPVGNDPPVEVPGHPMVGQHGMDMPPIPPPHHNDHDSSGSELYTTNSGRQRHRHRNAAAAGLAGAALGAAAAEGRHRFSNRANANTDSMESPPVSVKINMHNDGRKVTLRRLTEEEAAAQREARRRERQASAAGRRRNSSLSSSDMGEMGGEGGASAAADRRWRRTEALEAQQAAENEAAAASNLRPQAVTPAHSLYPSPPPPGSGGVAVDHSTGQAYQIPLPPPIPGSHSNLGPAGSVTSPGTETSGATEYANNRRRRRAERAQARLAREGRGNTVDFT
ncbi:hypothetical protein B0A52_07638 [Exophiala mesophila]|uniref:Cytochrome b561 domain-containing protein n=1 Tax=Exophiala mesophila TaxID=212818 RepID=A0A438MYD3_EXOME|nr:hypothetical protein B0A52_07638 [Exophiala mesophila]